MGNAESSPNGVPGGVSPPVAAAAAIAQGKPNTQSLGSAHQHHARQQQQSQRSQPAINSPQSPGRYGSEQTSSYGTGSFPGGGSDPNCQPLAYVSNQTGYASHGVASPHLMNEKHTYSGGDAQNGHYCPPRPGSDRGYGGRGVGGSVVPGHVTPHRLGQQHQQHHNHQYQPQKGWPPQHHQHAKSTANHPQHYSHPQQIQQKKKGDTSPGERAGKGLVIPYDSHNAGWNSTNAVEPKQALPPSPATPSTRGLPPPPPPVTPDNVGMQTPGMSNLSRSQQQHHQFGAGAMATNRSDFRTMSKKKKHPPILNTGGTSSITYADPVTGMAGQQFQGMGGQQLHGANLFPGYQQIQHVPSSKTPAGNVSRTPSSVNVSVMYAAEPSSLQSSRSSTPVDPALLSYRPGVHHSHQHQQRTPYNDTGYNISTGMSNLSLQHHYQQQHHEQIQEKLKQQQHHHFQHQFQHQYNGPSTHGPVSALAYGPQRPAGSESDQDEEDDTAQWKSAWEEDDDSSVEGNNGIDSSVNYIDMSHPFRPTMDGGHSSSSPIKISGPPTGMQRITPGSPEQHQQQMNASLAAQMQLKLPPHQPHQYAMHSQPQHVTVQQQQLHHTATPPRPQEEQSEEEVLSRQADRIIEENGVTWDTSAESVTTTDGETVHEKPNVKMFFPLLRVLGKGSFGKVVLVRKRTGAECGGLFAMKILRKAHLVKRRQIERTKTERKVLAVADHPFIMKLHFAFQTEDKLYLVLDYCPGGELFFHLSRYRRFPERVARFYSAELVLAIDHLHKKGIIYRDLKPENVLLDAEGHVKLGDFGLAKDKIRHPCKGATSMCGTPEYMAPEVLSQSGHGFCVDYWGLGMLVYEMMTGLPPWYTTDRAKLFKKLKSAPLEVPSYFTPGSTNYVKHLLERNQFKRLGFHGCEEVKRHAFYAQPPLNFEWLVQRRIEAPIRPCEGWKAPEATSVVNNTGAVATVEEKCAGSGNGCSADANGTSGPGTISAHTTTNISSNSSGKHSSVDQRGMLQLDAMSKEVIDAATANFDKAFTRLPVETEDATPADHASGSASDDELHVDTFVGFTFDENNLIGSAQQSSHSLADKRR